MIRSKDAASDAGLAVEEVTDEEFAVGGVGESLPNFAMGEDGILDIEADIVQVSAWSLSYGQSRLAR